MDSGKKAAAGNGYVVQLFQSSDWNGYYGGGVSVAGAIIWAVIEIICYSLGMIHVSGWTTLFIFNLFSFGIIMLTLGILGEYLWRTFDASRNRPPYIIEEDDEHIGEWVDEKK